jgi:GT2 family glycosyltransferase
VALPSVAVVVLNYNGLRFMDECFGSLSKLEYPAGRLQLVLADNASVDGSAAHVESRFPAVRVIRFQRNHGFSAGNNLAAGMLDAEYVAFVNSDMRVEPGFLMGLVEALGPERRVCASAKILSWDGKAMDCGGILLSFLGHGRADGYRDTDTAAYDQVRDVLAPCGGAMLIHRQAFLDVGGFDPDFFMYFEDIDLGWRLWILGHEVAFAPKAVCYHVHFGSTTDAQQARIGYLYERNALFTIIKNYEQQYLDRVLPLALLMHWKRSYLLGVMAGMDMDQCRFTEATANAPCTATAFAITNLQALKLQQAHVAAANDLIDGYEKLLEKRRWVQSRRRRSDAEIFSRIKKLSFDVCFDTEEYRATQARMIDLLGIKEAFGDLYDPSVPFAVRPPS